MRCIEAPQDYELADRDPSIFLAGGITGTIDWQKEVVSLLSDTGLVILNPRRNVSIPEKGPEAASQIEWEFHAMAKATAILFWFPEETLCPIALFELGKAIARRDKPVFVGAHPNYKRRFDLQIQLKLQNPANSDISGSLESLANRVRIWWSERLRNPY